MYPQQARMINRMNASLFELWRHIYSERVILEVLQDAIGPNELGRQFPCQTFLQRDVLRRNIHQISFIKRSRPSLSISISCLFNSGCNDAIMSSHEGMFHPECKLLDSWELGGLRSIPYHG